MLYSLTPQALPAGYGEALLPLEDAKAHLRVVSSDEDDLITTLRDVAIEFTEHYTGLFLAPRTGLVATFSGFGTGMRIGKGPASSLAVTGISYLDSDGAAVALVDGDWTLSADGALLPAIGTSWPTGYGSVTVTYSAGFGDGECPRPLIGAARLFLGNLFENRSTVTMQASAGELPMGFTTICGMYRIPVL